VKKVESPYVVNVDDLMPLLEQLSSKNHVVSWADIEWDIYDYCDTESDTIAYDALQSIIVTHTPKGIGKNLPFGIPHFREKVREIMYRK
jgi:hypothetical protein